MSKNKVTLDSLIESLLSESSRTFLETSSMQWETEHYLKIYDIVSQIKLREAARDSIDLVTDFSIDEKRREALFPTFITWLNSVGVDTKKVEIITVTNAGFGLKAKEVLSIGEAAFIVPERACLTTNRVKESKLKILAEKDPMLRSMQNILLAVFLVYENYAMASASYWKPYLDVLPKIYNTILYFTRDEVMLLKHSPTVFREAVRMYCNIARQFAYFHHVFRKGTDSACRTLKSVFTFNRYCWAVSSVITRQNMVPNLEDRSKDVLCLVPLWDLCNHSETGIISTDYNMERKEFICYANEEYAVGDDFKIFYGSRASLDYFIHGAFVPSSHTDDFYTLELGISINDNNYARKKALLGHIGMNCQSSFQLRPQRIIVAKTLFAFICIFQADKGILDKIESMVADDKKMNEYLTFPTEKTWEYLSARFTLLKKATGNSLASLLKILFKSKINDESNQPLTSRVQMILQLLKNEEKLLEVLAFCCNDYSVQLKKTGQISSSEPDQNLMISDELERVVLSN